MKAPKALAYRSIGGTRKVPLPLPEREAIALYVPCFLDFEVPLVMLNEPPPTSFGDPSRKGGVVNRQITKASNESVPPHHHRQHVARP